MVGIRIVSHLDLRGGEGKAGCAAHLLDRFDFRLGGSDARLAASDDERDDARVGVPPIRDRDAEFPDQFRDRGRVCAAARPFEYGLVPI